jgi:hypothetical protein
LAFCNTLYRCLGKVLYLRTVSSPPAPTVEQFTAPTRCILALAAPGRNPIAQPVTELTGHLMSGTTR